MSAPPAGSPPVTPALLVLAQHPLEDRLDAARGRRSAVDQRPLR